jgi:hypothetical protein
MPPKAGHGVIAFGCSVDAARKIFKPASSFRNNANVNELSDMFQPGVIPVNPQKQAFSFQPPALSSFLPGTRMQSTISRHDNSGLRLKADR